MSAARSMLLAKMAALAQAVAELEALMWLHMAGQVDLPLPLGASDSAADAKEPAGAAQVRQVIVHGDDKAPLTVIEHFDDRPIR